MDRELKELAALALRNAFWQDFSALFNAYLLAAEGLGVDDQEMMMGELTSAYGRDLEAGAQDLPDLWVKSQLANPSYRSIMDALEDKYAYEIYLSGQMVFKRKDGEWYFTGDEPNKRKP